MWAKILFGVLLVAGIATWLSKDPHTQADRAQAEQLAALPAAENAEFTAEGIVVRYQSGELSTYYLLYENTKHQFLRKELRFTKERGCNPRAGDMPCLLAGDTNPVPVTVGSYVRVTGLFDAQRIRVSAIEGATDSRGTFDFVRVAVGEAKEVGEATVRLDELFGGGFCEVMLGCYTEGIVRATFALRSDRDASQTSMVPGMVRDVDGGVLVYLWGDEALGEAVFAYGHGKGQ